MQFKTTVRYHLTPVRMAIIEFVSLQMLESVWCSEKGTLLHCLFVGMQIGAATMENHMEVH